MAIQLISDFLARSWTRHLFSNSGGAAYPPPATVYQAISTTPWNKDGTGGTEPVASTGYTRQPTTWNAATLEVVGDPTATIVQATGFDFTPVLDIGTPVAAGLYDDPAAGNLLWANNYGGTQPVAAGDRYQITNTITTGSESPATRIGWKIELLRDLLNFTFRGTAMTVPAFDWVLFFRNFGNPLTTTIFDLQDWTEFSGAGYARMACVGPWMNTPTSSVMTPALALSADVPWFNATGGFNAFVGFASGGVLYSYFRIDSLSGFAGDAISLRGYDSVGDFGVFVGARYSG